MATNNSLNNRSMPMATTALTIDPGASGDSYTQFSINGTGEFRLGVDNTASNAFVLSQGSALGTNDTFIMDTNGQLLMPLQPAFFAYLASSDLNVSGNGTVWQLGSTTALTERFDQGSDFNTNGTFTAPITGKYFLSTGSKFTGLTISTTLTLVIVTSNISYGSAAGRAASAVDIGCTDTVLADMDVGDTAVITMTVTGEAGATADAIGAATPVNFFCGFLAV